VEPAEAGLMLESLAFEHPSALWLLLLVPVLVAMAVFTRRRIARGRLIVALAARLLLLLLLIVAASELTYGRLVDDLGVVFVLDRSASVSDQGRRAALGFVQVSVKHMEEGDRAGVVVFGADAYVEQEVSEQVAMHAIETDPGVHQTDISAGLRLAQATLPADAAHRVVLLSDGEETRGDAAGQVLLGAENELSVVPLGRGAVPEVVLESLVVPDSVNEGEGFDVRVIARSVRAGPGVLRMYRNERYIGEIPVDLTGGRADVFTFRQVADEPGLLRYRAVLDIDDKDFDALTQNNEVMATVQVSGSPRVLYVEGLTGQARHLATALRGDGIVVDVVAPGDMPPTLAAMRPYACIVLSDVPAHVLTSVQQQALQSFVRDLGRGFVMVGGENSYGVGGYYKTPVEELLPVQMDIEDKKHFPSLAMVLAIDRSGSMAGQGQGSKIGMAKEAAIRSVELMTERDMVGVVTFDAAGAWAVPLQTLDNKQAVMQRIASIRAGGGTDIYPALKLSYQSLAKTDAALKHVVLLSDGITGQAAFEPLIGGAYRDHAVTLTAIAVGSDADRTTMRQFAQWGGGRYYLVTDPHAIPQIFTRETMLASRSFIVEEDFHPLPGDPSDVLKGLDPGGLPALHGYVATSAKPRATVALLATDDMPLLAHWRYGLGKSVAFTSDCKARWGRDWLHTPQYTKMWSQAVRWAMGDPLAGDLQVVTEIDRGELRITVDAFDQTGNFRNFLEGSARVVAPDLSVRELPLRQVAPGRYAATMDVDQDGSYLAGVSMKSGDAPVGQVVTEAVQPYSPEYRTPAVGSSLLPELARLGGGEVLSDPAQVFRRPDVARRVPEPLWPPLLLIALILLLVDVALRRLDFSAWGKPGVVTTVQAIRAAPRAPPPEVAAATSAVATTQAPAAEPQQKERVAVTPVGPDAEKTAAPEAADGSYVGGLLAARRRAKDRLDGDE